MVRGIKFKVYLLFSISFLGIICCARDIAKHERYFNKNFVTVKYTNSSERELRIAFKGILLLETTAFLDSEYEVKFKQITDGFRFVQTAYQSGIPKDCEYSEDKDKILGFVYAFASDAAIFHNKQQGNVFDLYNRHGNNSRKTEEAVQFFRHRKFLGPLKNLIKIKHSIRVCHKIAKKIHMLITSTVTWLNFVSTRKLPYNSKSATRGW